jgi:hypothetical protein
MLGAGYFHNLSNFCLSPLNFSESPQGLQQLTARASQQRDVYSLVRQLVSRFIHHQQVSRFIHHQQVHVVACTQTALVGRQRHLSYAAARSSSHDPNWSAWKSIFYSEPGFCLNLLVAQNSSTLPPPPSLQSRQMSAVSRIFCRKYLVSVRSCWPSG